MLRWRGGELAMLILELERVLRRRWDLDVMVDVVGMIFVPTRILMPSEMEFGERWREGGEWW